MRADTIEWITQSLVGTIAHCKMHRRPAYRYEGMLYDFESTVTWIRYYRRLLKWIPVFTFLAGQMIGMMVARLF